MNIIVTFKEKVNNDYNCFWRIKADYSQRFNTQAEADEAAKEWVRTIPVLPYRRQVSVHKGSVITSPLNYWLESKILKYANLPKNS